MGNASDGEMKHNREANWRKYKSDFLSANHCTDDEFEAAYIAFMENKPNTKAYRQFAREYGITIFPEPNIPKDVRAALSVNISAMKVMAKTSAEAEAAVEEILSVSR